MKAIKGIVIAIIVIIVIAIIGFLTLNKKSLDTNSVVSKATNSPVAQGVANTPADSNNIVSPKEKTTTAKEDTTIDKPKANESTNSTKALNDSNSIKDNKTTTSSTAEHKENNTTKNSNIANNTNTNNTTNNTVPSKNNAVPVNTTKAINNNTNNTKVNDNNNNVNNTNNKTTNTSETQNLQSYYLNQLTGITEQINAMPTKNDDDAQLLQNAGTQCNLWNAELNKIMNKLSTTLPSSEASTLQNEEFQWIQNRNNEVQNTSNSGGSIAPILGAQKEAQLTKERCYYLVNNYM
ncbi:lysozyme inhibitor LprI family protein [Clostridium massiliamazoniense]|uniref:lysozyme inhibitor LprI family protein n=1 Tax=Clostridium massiliamazoniense TaxID=1347366 RepID=UPI0006D7F143|nr:lysozyme inhibitor LprI family protein [Clostridium massiliamazoniense]